MPAKFPTFDINYGERPHSQDRLQESLSIDLEREAGITGGGNKTPGIPAPIKGLNDSIESKEPNILSGGNSKVTTPKSSKQVVIRNEEVTNSPLKPVHRGSLNIKNQKSNLEGILKDKKRRDNSISFIESNIGSEKPLNSQDFLNDAQMAEIGNQNIDDADFDKTRVISQTFAKNDMDSISSMEGRKKASSQLSKFKDKNRFRSNITKFSSTQPT